MNDFAINNFADKDPANIIGESGNWRIVKDPEDPEKGWPWVQFRLTSGQWVFPDCGFSCKKCEACLGCARKSVRQGEPPGPWSITIDDYARCPDGSDHECSNEDDDADGDEDR